MIRREGKTQHGFPSRHGVSFVDMWCALRNMLRNILPFVQSHISYAADAAGENSNGQHMSLM